MPSPPVTANGDAGDRRGDDESAVDAFFRRTPHLDLSETEPLPIGQALTATVFLDTEAARPGETVQEVVIDLPEDLDVLEIDVLLAATEHFAIRNECMKTLSLHRDDVRSPDAHLRPRGRVRRAGRGRACRDGVPDLPAPPVRPGASRRRAAGCHAAS